ncbi:GntR family transcriptional regulator [Vibrio algarum]|uniref:GntR family transcriptional regulator n=1 Tax=Vibrio algarum TaxID=3020714 RepID=A0ABT4YRU8_9VIBR|nr:GntR family transcriptional regulator [Vibrio sp. KJ40-1]MDB1124286.1 GntR family transcriptional regulator [Vibrio sp. KJ40-1]
MTDWQDNQPIFRQLSEQITEQILQGVWQEEQPLPSVRTVAAELKINHLTVMKGYQLLVDDGLVEKRRGQGMFVTKGALKMLQEKQKTDFMQRQIPLIAQTLSRIELPIDEFIDQLKHFQKLQQDTTGEK